MCASPSVLLLLWMNVQVGLPSTYLYSCPQPRQVSWYLGLEAAIISARCFHCVACSLATPSDQRWQLGTMLLCIAGCGGDLAGPCGSGNKRACALVWGPGGAGRGTAELRCLVYPRAAGTGGWELCYCPLPLSGGCGRILLQEGPGPDLHLPWLLCSANGNVQASPLSAGRGEMQPRVEWGG